MAEEERDSGDKPGRASSRVTMTINTHALVNNLTLRVHYYSVKAPGHFFLKHDAVHILPVSQSDYQHVLVVRIRKSSQSPAARRDSEKWGNQDLGGHARKQN